VVSETTSITDHILSQDCEISYYFHGNFESFCLSINVGVSITLVFSFHLVKPWSFHWLVWKCCRTVTHLRSLLKYTIREEQIALHRHVKLSRTSFMLQCRGWEWMVHLKEEDNEARIKVISVGFDNWFCRPYMFLWCDGGEVEGGPPYVVCYYGWDTLLELLVLSCLSSNADTSLFQEVGVMFPRYTAPG